MSSRTGGRALVLAALAHRPAQLFTAFGHAPLPDAHERLAHDVAAHLRLPAHPLGEGDRHLGDPEAGGQRPPGEVDLAWRVLQAGYRIVEVPITFAERERGESKMSGSIVREALWRVTQWGAAHRTARARNAVRTRRAARSARRAGK